ncbi:hypothetical protein HPB47_017148 [Ixodes persulcatus]|uniref:Uncharacterized protein n=1 Tax=Ixodes persulcatus TaxID=34615 RepID=A0AC60QP39_IXOPE|nr:hypothetical protein HPB47_017148 [Ixodes persulcatus]
MRVLLCLQTCLFSRSCAARRLTRNQARGTASEIALAADERPLHIPKLEIPPASLRRISEIALRTGRSKWTVTRVIKAFRDDGGRLVDAPRSGRPRATDEEEDRLIVDAAVTDPFMTAKEIQQELSLSLSRDGEKYDGYDWPASRSSAVSANHSRLISRRLFRQVSRLGPHRDEKLHGCSKAPPHGCTAPGETLVCKGPGALDGNGVV